MSLTSNFSRAVYYARINMGMTQAQAAEGLDISLRWYQTIENGRCLPSAKLTLKFIAFFGINGKLLRDEERENVSISDD